MAKTLLRSGCLDDFQAVGDNGQPVFESALQIRETLRLRQQPVELCLAIPQRNDSGDAVDWYAPFAGKAISWAAADDQQRQQALQTLEHAWQSASLLSQQCQQSAKTAVQLFGRLLEKALQFPGSNHVYLVNNRPVITFWGFVNIQQPVTDSDDNAGNDSNADNGNMNNDDMDNGNIINDDDGNSNSNNLDNNLHKSLDCLRQSPASSIPVSVSASSLLANPDAPLLVTAAYGGELTSAVVEFTDGELANNGLANSELAKGLASGLTEAPADDNGVTVELSSAAAIKAAAIKSAAIKAATIEAAASKAEPGKSPAENNKNAAPSPARRLLFCLMPLAALLVVAMVGGVIWQQRSASVTTASQVNTGNLPDTVSDKLPASASLLALTAQLPLNQASVAESASQPATDQPPDQVSKPDQISKVAANSAEIPPDKANPPVTNVLVMDPRQVREGRIDFLDGQWAIALANPQPSLPDKLAPPQQIRLKIYRSNGSLSVTLADNVTCTIEAFAGLHQSGTLMIKPRSKARCQNGTRYTLPQFACKSGENSEAQCVARYLDWAEIPVSVSKVDK